MTTQPQKDVPVDVCIGSFSYIPNQPNQPNQINGCEKRSNQSFHMKHSVAEMGRKYAKAAHTQSGELIELALIEYIMSHPVETIPIIIQQQIASSLPSRRDTLRMVVMSREIRFILDRLNKFKTSNNDKIKKRLIQLLGKGTEIREPTEEFMTLLEEAMKYV